MWYDGLVVVFGVGQRADEGGQLELIPFDGEVDLIFELVHVSRALHERVIVEEDRVIIAVTVGGLRDEAGDVARGDFPQVLVHLVAVDVSQRDAPPARLQSGEFRLLRTRPVRYLARRAVAQPQELLRHVDDFSRYRPVAVVDQYHLLHHRAVGSYIRYTSDVGDDGRYRVGDGWRRGRLVAGRAGFHEALQLLHCSGRAA